MQAINYDYVKDFTKIRDHPDLHPELAKREGEVCLALLHWIRSVYEARMDFFNTPAE